MRIIARFLKLSNENIKENAKGSFGDVQSRSFSATKENVMDGEASGVGNNPREKRVKGLRPVEKRKEDERPKSAEKKGQPLTRQPSRRALRCGAYRKPANLYVRQDLVIQR